MLPNRKKLVLSGSLDVNQPQCVPDCPHPHTQPGLVPAGRTALAVTSPGFLSLGAAQSSPILRAPGSPRGLCPLPQTSPGAPSGISPFPQPPSAPRSRSPPYRPPGPPGGAGGGARAGQLPPGRRGLTKTRVFR